MQYGLHSMHRHALSTHTHKKAPLVQQDNTTISILQKKIQTNKN